MINNCVRFVYKISANHCNNGYIILIFHAKRILDNNGFTNAFENPNNVNAFICGFK
jgi:hypothetical protein